ncbi:MAG: hypothetical protein AAGG44_17630 [Planctomycetota bacterium]
MENGLKLSIQPSLKSAWLMGSRYYLEISKSDLNRHPDPIRGGLSTWSCLPRRNTGCPKIDPGKAKLKTL